MLNTFANVRDHAVKKGLEAILCDGIPEGFSYKKPDIIIAGKDYLGEYMAFIPLTDVEVEAQNTQDLLDLYNIEYKKCQKK